MGATASEIIVRCASTSPAIACAPNNIQILELDGAKLLRLVVAWSQRLTLGDERLL
jgi:hypothetical protein